MNQRHVKSLFVRPLFSLLVFLTVTSINAHAQLMWRVTSPSSDKASYILGTYHLAPVSMIDSIAGLREVICSVDTVYGELDMSLTHSQDVALALVQTMQAPSDSTLDVVLSPAQIDTLAEVLKTRVGLPIDPRTFYRLKPSAVSATITILMAQRLLGNAYPTTPFDEKIQQLARECGRPVKGLESVNFQSDLLYGAPISQQANELMSDMRDLAENKDHLFEITNAFLTQDFPSFEEYVRASLAGSKTADRMVYSRNATWAEYLDPILRNKSGLVAVGAAHLVGPFGVLEKLRRRGFSVSPVKP